MGYAATVMCSVDVILPSVKENSPSLGIYAVIFSIMSDCANEVELPSNVHTMSEGSGLALAIQEMFTSSPSTTVRVVLRASTRRVTIEKSQSTIVFHRAGI